MLKNDSQGKSLIGQLQYLTYYESEFGEGVKIASFSPADPCFSTLLICDFLDSSMQSEEIFELTKNIKFCLKVLSWIKLSTEYLPKEQQEKAFEVLCEVVNAKLLEMKNGDTVLLPGGWSSFDNCGHFMLYLIKRVDNNMFIKTRINSHFSSDTKSKKLKINRDQSMQKKDLSEFTHDLFRLQFPLLFQSLNALEDHEKMDFCEKYDELEVSKSIFMEGQKYINNCAFMAFNALYIYMQSEPPDGELQIAFRKYLKCLITT